MHKIRVLHICRKYVPGGGSFVRMNNLLRCLAQEKLCEVHLLTSKNLSRNVSLLNLQDEEIVDRVHIHHVPTVSDTIKKMRKTCKKYRIDIIHAHLPRYALTGYLLRKPVISEIHGFISYPLPKSLFIQHIYRLSNKIIVLSNSMRDEAIRKFHLPQDKIEVVYNGIDMDRFDYKKYKRESDYNNKFVIGYVGTFYKWQGIEELIKAFSVILKARKDIRLLLIGDGPYRQVIDDRIRELNIRDYVIEPGTVPFEQVPGYIASIDIFVISRPRIIETNSVVPLKLLEGMAMAKPVIATDIPGMREVIENGFNGVLIDSQNLVNSLVDKILMLLDNKSMRVNLGLNAYKSVRKRFSWDISVKHLFDIYTKLASRGKI